VLFNGFAYVTVILFVVNYIFFWSISLFHYLGSSLLSKSYSSTHTSYYMLNKYVLVYETIDLCPTSASCQKPQNKM